MEKDISELKTWKEAIFTRKRINEVLRLIINNSKSFMYKYPYNKKKSKYYLGFTKEFNQKLGIDGDTILDKLFDKRDNNSEKIHINNKVLKEKEEVFQ